MSIQLNPEQERKVNHSRDLKSSKNIQRQFLQLCKCVLSGAHLPKKSWKQPLNVLVSSPTWMMYYNNDLVTRHAHWYNADLNITGVTSDVVVESKGHSIGVLVCLIL